MFLLNPCDCGFLRSEKCFNSLWQVTNLLKAAQSHLISLITLKIRIPPFQITLEFFPK